MQTDTWLTETPYPDRCPLCNQPLVVNSNICPSCGFTAHEPVRSSASTVRQPAPGPSSRQPNPITPIPARASAQRVNQYLPGNAPSTGLPSSTEATGWRHHSASYEAASSLSSLSLIISETPTTPPRTTRRLSPPVGSSPHIDEIDTLPPPISARVQPVPSASSDAFDPPGSVSLKLDDLGVSQSVVVVPWPTALDSSVAIDEIDTIPERNGNSSRALVPVHQESRSLAVDAASWASSSPAVISEADRFISERSRGRRRRRKSKFHLLDRLRWWLLRPGHMEFLLWLSGSILLFGITFLLLLATVLSMALPGTQNWGNLPSSTVAGTTTVAANSVSPDVHMRLVLSGSSRLLPGSEFQLRGQGFLSRCQVTFLLDGHWPLLDQEGHAISVLTDAKGDFTINLWLGSGSAWSVGVHQVLASEVGTNHQTSTTITIASDPAVSSTQIVSNPAPQPTPVRPVVPTPTPVPPAPTVGSAPTPTPGVTPTIGPSPTAATTPTAPVLKATPTKGSGAPGLGNSLNNNDSDTLFGRLAHLNPLVWLILACYLLSMVFLGLAGLLRRRRPAKRA